MLLIPLLDKWFLSNANRRLLKTISFMPDQNKLIKFCGKAICTWRLVLENSWSNLLSSSISENSFCDALPLKLLVYHIHDLCVLETAVVKLTTSPCFTYQYCMMLLPSECQAVCDVNEGNEMYILYLVRWDECLFPPMIIVLTTNSLYVADKIVLWYTIKHKY